MKGRTVILAAGDFPRKGGEPWRLLASAECIIACDSAANTFKRHFHRTPNIIIGDLDSIGNISSKRAQRSCLVIRDTNPSINDLAKAFSYCRAQGRTDPIVVGATGKREDHTIGNIYRALAAGVRLVTDEGEFLPVKGSLSIKTWKGIGLSVFAPDPHTKMSSKGLKWKLEGVRFTNPACATLNRASSEKVTVTSNRPAYLYVARNPKAVQAIVSLGSNLGNRAFYLRRAVKKLSQLPGTRLLDLSEVIETEGVDVPLQYASLKFLNQVALFETTLTPLAFSRQMHAIEDSLGRVRVLQNGPRTIDIDLISMSGIKMNTHELTLPHPRAKKRSFVTTPMRSLGQFVV